MCIFITKSNGSCQGSHFTGVGREPTHPTALAAGLGRDLGSALLGMMLWLHCSPRALPGGVWSVQCPPPSLPCVPGTAFAQLNTGAPCPPLGIQPIWYKKVSWLDIQQQFLPALWPCFWYFQGTSDGQGSPPLFPVAPCLGAGQGGRAHSHSRGSPALPFFLPLQF